MNPLRPTIHIVDDDGAFRTAISRLLRATGFAVRAFPSATEFLTQRDADAPGCVIVDLQMPEMNGLDLQAALGRTQNPMPILFLTGCGDIPSTVRAMRDVLTVPEVEKGRYYSIQFTDAYTFNIDYCGTRATGNDAASFLVVGPGWKGETPRASRR